MLLRKWEKVYNVRDRPFPGDSRVITMSDTRAAKFMASIVRRLNIFSTKISDLTIGQHQEFQSARSPVSRKSRIYHI